MSNNEHTITPPPELVQQWRDDWVDQSDRSGLWVGEYIATQAARWGANQELEACLSWMADRYGNESHAMTLFRAARRPKSPSLKQQALEILDDVDAQLGAVHYNVLRRALEALPDD
jgi:hypothetical protein